MKKTITVRCQNCAEPCNHTFELKVFKDKGGHWVASGPYQSKEDADKVIQGMVKALDERENQNRA